MPSTLTEVNLSFIDLCNAESFTSAVEKYFSRNAMSFVQNGFPLIGKNLIINHLSTLSTGMKIVDIKQDLEFSDKTFAYSSGRLRYQNESSARFILIWKKENKDWRIIFSRGLIPGENLINLNKSLPPIVDSQLIRVENEFYILSKREGIPKGFYTFMDDKGFALGANDAKVTKQDYLNTLESSKGKEKSKVLLEWYPIYSYLDIGEMYGFNIGPWRYSNEEAEAFGYFMTIWKKQTNGNWNFLFDGGTDSPPNEYAK